MAPRGKKVNSIPVEPDMAYDRAIEKAKNPAMTTAGNPLAEEDCHQGMEDRIIHTNMERLHQDAKLRRGPNGGVYAGFMQQRFGG